MREASGVQHAATVILVRPALRETKGVGSLGPRTPDPLPEPFEVLLTRRPAGMKFLGGMYVFPGGGVRKEDCAERVLRRCHGLPGERAQRILGGSLSRAVSLGHWVAGIRELFEGVGVLLCVAESGEPIDLRDGGTQQRLADKRAALLVGSTGFGEILESEQLLCDVARLVYFSHWLTPEEFPVRFDTRFYLASLPADQQPVFNSREVAQGLWINPERALDLCQRGELPLIFPTFASLRTLADFDSPQSLFAEYGGGQNK